MKLSIETADNGYILSYYDEYSKQKNNILIEGVESSEPRTTLKLLWNIMEHFNLSGSKHDEERVYIVLKNQKMEEIE